MDIKELQDIVIKFRNQRNWKQFHNPKDIAISLSLETSELLEHFQWKNKKELEGYLKSNKSEIGKELVDILYWVLLISYDLKIDIVKVFKEKMIENNKKYPVKKSKNRNIKYTKL